MTKVLIIDDDRDMALLLSNFLHRKGYLTESAFSGSRGLQKFREWKADMVLCDFRLGDMEGRQVLAEIKKTDPSAIVIIITGYSDIKTAVEVMRCGAYDYITKPLIPDEVLNILSRAIGDHENRDVVQSSHNGSENRVPVHDEEEYIIGRDALTRELYQEIGLVAPTNYSVILYGESGTGKEVIARTIHRQSQRAGQPFVAVDCGTLSKELAGSELFGHMKGAFTGAVNDKEGFFEIANGGTLFLDEVGNLPLDVQATLLRVIQERKLKRVGGTKEISCDFRIIVASNENLWDACHEGKFREDLFFRFNEFSLQIPALRLRKKDIPLFADFFLKKASCELNRELLGFEAETMDLFMQYDWPGNLREFKNVIRRAALLTSSGLIPVRVLPPEIIQSVKTGRINGEPAAQVEKPSEINLKSAATHAEYGTIMRVLAQVNFNKTRAAEILQIDRKTLYNKIKSYESQHAGE